MFNNTLRNACIALTERYLNLRVDGELRQPIKPRQHIFNGVGFQAFSNKVVRRCAARSHVYSRQEVVEMYTGSKQRAYAAAMESLLYEPLTKHDAELNTFIKFEKTNINKAPRIINPRSTRYTLELARYLKKLEKPVFSAINSCFRSKSSHTVIKGLNVYDSAAAIRAKWDRFTDPIAISGDITKLDMHVSRAALEYEHSIYNRIFRSRRLKRLLSWQLLNTGRAYFKDGSVSFSMQGTRSSGDINTSLGNVIIVCSILYAYTQGTGVCVELLNNGDDFCFILERKDYHQLDGLPEFFEECGMPLKMEPPVDEFERIVFCQTQPVYDGRRWRMVREIRTCLRKDTICTVDVHTRESLRQWLHAVGSGNGVITTGIPMLQSFYAMFRRLGLPAGASMYQRAFKNTSMWERTHGVGDAIYTEVTQDARYSFYVATGIVSDVQISFEHIFDSVTTLEEVDCLSETIGASILNNETYLIN